MFTSEDEEIALYDAFLNSPDKRLIAPAEDSAPSIEFRFGGSWRECRIWEGYFDASLFLLREILQRGSIANNLIFPALFNLRHAIEVALKYHIQYAGGVIPKGAKHNLVVLIGAFMQTAEDLDDETSYISNCMLDCISELALIDPRSVTFRYSTELDGSSIEITPELWDLRRLYFMADQLSLWFDELSVRINISQCEVYQA